MKAFNVTATPNIVFGIGKRNELPKIVKKYGSHIALVIGETSFKSSNYGKQLIALLEDQEIRIEMITIEKEPTPDMIDKAVVLLKQENVDAVVAIGGGAVLDAGKAIAAMVCHSSGIINYLEGIGDTQPTEETLPFIAMPTTSGTGSEATKNAVISVIGAQGFKKSLRHDNYIPNVAIIDPELTVSCSKGLTAASGMDAFTQLLESYVSNNASGFTDSLALKGLTCIKSGLKASVENGKDINARADMSYAALISGITLANAGLGTVHGFASSIGGFFDIPHGTVCGTLMGATNRFTVTKIKETGQGEYALVKYAQVGKLFAGHHSESEEYYVQYLLDLIDSYTKEFELETLSTFGVQESDFEKIIGATGNKNNPVALNNEDLKAILKERL